MAIQTIEDLGTVKKTVLLTNWHAVVAQGIPQVCFTRTETTQNSETVTYWEWSECDLLWGAPDHQFDTLTEAIASVQDVWNSRM